MKSLQDKVVVITGAGSGIGRALALEAGRRGAVLALSDWNEEAVKETERAAAGVPGARKSLARKVDVRSEKEIASFAEDVQRELGGAHVIVNNAGVTVSDYVGTMKRTDFEWLMDINFWGVVRGTEAFLPQLKSKDDSHVVNISSVFGLIGVPSQSAYNASKFAVRGYTEALRQELARTSVNVTCVHPGGVKTNIVKNGRNRTNTTGAAMANDAMAIEFEKIARTTPEAAAKIIWGGVLANEPRVLVGGDAHLIDMVQRLFPTRYPAVFRAVQRLYERTTGTTL
jgi:NAD(P)-dependent dehydrogenase (short-subunit alcohol dehydrogenase family)